MAGPKINPEMDIDSWITLVTLIGIAAWGGVAGYLAKLKKGHPRPFRVAELLVEIVISAFVGLITVALCVWAGYDIYFTGAAAGVAGHMGSRALMLMEPAFLAALDSITGGRGRKRDGR